MRASSVFLNTNNIVYDCWNSELINCIKDKEQCAEG
jgi:hypothetical protein